MTAVVELRPGRAAEADAVARRWASALQQVTGKPPAAERVAELRAVLRSRPVRLSWLLQQPDPLFMRSLLAETLRARAAAACPRHGDGWDPLLRRPAAYAGG